MLKEIFDSFLREISASKLLPIPKNFYDSALSYVQSLKIRANNEVGTLQRKLWEEEARIIEDTLRKIKDVRIKKALRSVLEGQSIDLEELPPEEVFPCTKIMELFEIAIKGEQEDESRDKMLLIIRRMPEEALIKRLNLPRLEEEDVIFINRRTGNLLINLGLAEEAQVRT
ncbi:MAG: hypothetical protein N3F04_03775 [Candidatus Nezhaarchaeota archaeon]|nr:hypothetical protein [Candidatus Nezhaarchaeota archaeon]MCX8141884.1 hypothetical protein [Candidatus Nezhaarchaeota archaeon]MDW8050335.1 hypothetical protein [Nitrososphaerota archaeon]